MGRQINFYMGPETERSFFAFLREKGYKIIHFDMEQRKEVEITDTNNISDMKWFLALYKQSYGELVFKDNSWGADIIDFDETPAIEFTRTKIWEDEEKMYRGRLWFSSYIDFRDEETCKLFVKEYNQLVRWIKKNVPRQEYCYYGKLYKEIKERIKKGYKLLYM